MGILGICIIANYLDGYRDK